MMESALLLVQLVSTTVMAGIILFVHVVHYPLMAAVGSDAFPRYQQLHTTRTTWVVMPPMLLEATAALLLFALRPSLLSGAGLALVGVIWAATFFLSVPKHRRLLEGFHAATHARLVETNTVRTVAWVLRVPVALAMAV